jgi:hypothetical protein
MYNLNAHDKHRIRNQMRIVLVSYLVPQNATKELIDVTSAR